MGLRMGCAAALACAVAIARPDDAPEPLVALVSRLVEGHEYGAASAVVFRALSEQPANAAYHELLANVQHAAGDDDRAVSSYRRAILLGGGSPARLKGLASAERRLGRYRDAVGDYEAALDLAPDDAEARDDLRDLRLSRGLQLRGWAGGWEADRAQRGAGLLASYGGIDRTELYAGYVYSDQRYYATRRTYAQAYHHYANGSYAKLEASWKNYSYPTDPQVQRPNPDATAYTSVPSAEIEARQELGGRADATLAYEVLVPTLFYDSSTTIVNHKLSARATVRPIEAVRLELVAGVLRDPDPARTQVRGRENPRVAPGPAPATNVVFHFSSLVGGGVELALPGVVAEVQYLPNRDLDQSYSDSILATASVTPMRALTLTARYVHDRYSAYSAYAGKTADVGLLSADIRASPTVSIGGGVKAFAGPAGSGPGVFLSMTYRTGLGP